MTTEAAIPTPSPIQEALFTKEEIRATCTPPERALTTLDKIRALRIYDAGESLVASGFNDAVSTIRNGFRIAWGFDNKVVSRLASVFVIPLTLVAGVLLLIDGIADLRKAQSIDYKEGKINALVNEMGQAVLTIVAGTLWAVCQFVESPLGTTTAKVIEFMGNYVINPIFILSSLIGLVFTSRKLYRVVKFEDEFFEIVAKKPEDEAQASKAPAEQKKKDAAEATGSAKPHRKHRRRISLDQKQKRELLQFFKKHLCLSEQEKEKIKQEILSKESQKKLFREVLKQHPELDHAQLEEAFAAENPSQLPQDVIALLDPLRKEFQAMLKQQTEKRMDNARAVKKEEFESKTNGECSQMILGNLVAWEAGNNKGETASLTEAAQKVRETLFWNKVILGAKIAILVAGIVGMILFTVFPGGLPIIALISIATGVVWVLLDIRGSALWPKIRHYFLTEEFEKKQPREKIVLQPFSPRANVTCWA